MEVPTFIIILVDEKTWRYNLPKGLTTDFNDVIRIIQKWKLKWRNTPLYFLWFSSSIQLFTIICGLGTERSFT